MGLKDVIYFGTYVSGPKSWGNKWEKRTVQICSAQYIRFGYLP